MEDSSPLTRTEDARKTLSDLDMNMRLVLERSDLTDEDKVRLYKTALDKFIRVRDKLDPSPVAGSSSHPATSLSTSEKQANESVETRLLEAVPHVYKTRAQNLMTRLKDSPHFGWTKDGEMIWKDRVLTGSNLTDLVLDVVKKPSKVAQPPERWREFADVLRQVNVPKTFVGNEERWEHISRVPRTPNRPEGREDERAASPQIGLGVRKKGSKKCVRHSKKHVKTSLLPVSGWLRY